MAPRQRQVNIGDLGRHLGRGRAGRCGEPAPNKVPKGPERQATLPSIDNQDTQMASIDLESLDIDQLTELLAKAQTEIASREKGNRKELRAELERRVAADGYKMADLFPEFGTGARRKRPAKYHDPQNPDTTWSGIGRAPKWVQAILDERGIDMAAFKSIPMYQIHASS